MRQNRLMLNGKWRFRTCYVHIYRIISLTKFYHYSQVERFEFPSSFGVFADGRRWRWCNYTPCAGSMTELKIAIVSDVFKVMGSSFQTLGAATEKAHLPKFSFVLGTISLCEIDDLSCQGVFERCRRLAK